MYFIRNMLICQRIPDGKPSSMYLLACKYNQRGTGQCVLVIRGEKKGKKNKISRLFRQSQQMMWSDLNSGLGYPLVLQGLILGWSHYFCFALVTL